jgi:hypothetical protein
MSPVDHREKTTLRDEPESECTPFALRTLLRNALLAPRTVLRGSATFNSFKMTLLRNEKDNIHGMILLHANDGWSPQANAMSITNSIRMCTLAEKRHQEGAGAKPLRMISL